MNRWLDRDIHKNLKLLIAIFKCRGFAQPAMRNFVSQQLKNKSIAKTVLAFKTSSERKRIKKQEKDAHPGKLIPRHTIDCRLVEIMLSTAAITGSKILKPHTFDRVFHSTCITQQVNEEGPTKDVTEYAVKDTSRKIVEISLWECSGWVKSYIATLNPVDLAGSERASQTKVDGVRLKEGYHISRSLLTGNRRSDCIPCRNSKLTRILQTSFGGNSRTAIICTMSPPLCQGEQSRNTLSFAAQIMWLAVESSLWECSGWAKSYIGTLNPVDLAGSERASQTKFVAEKQLVKHLLKEVARLEAELLSPEPCIISMLKFLLMDKDLKIQQMMLELEALERPSGEELYVEAINHLYRSLNA